MHENYLLSVLLASLMPCLGVDSNPVNGSNETVAIGTAITHLASSGRLAEASTQCRDTLASAALASASVRDRASVLTLCGRVSEGLGDLTTAEVLLTRALELWEDGLGPGSSDPVLAEPMLQLSIVLRRQGKYVLSEHYARKAIALIEKANAVDTMPFNLALTTLAIVQIRLGQYTAAEVNLTRVRKSIESSSGPLTLADADVFSGLGLLYLQVGRYFEAEAAYKKAISARVDNGASLSSARDLAHLVRTYVALRKYDEAEAAGTRALSTLTHHLGPSHIEIAGILNQLAQLRSAQKRYAEARQFLKDAVEVSTLSGSANAAQRVILMGNLGVISELEGAHADAETMFRRVLQAQESDSGTTSRELSLTLHNLAVTCSRQGHVADAFEHSARALRVARSELARNDPAVIGMLTHHAQLLRRLHRKSEAIRLEREVDALTAEHALDNPARFIVNKSDLMKHILAGSHAGRQTSAPGRSARGSRDCS